MDDGEFDGFLVGEFVGNLVGLLLGSLVNLFEGKNVSFSTLVETVLLSKTFSDVDTIAVFLVLFTKTGLILLLF